MVCSGADNSEYRDEFLEKAVWLVENGVDVNTFDKAGCTALHYAAKNYFRKLVQYFLKECNMNPSIKDPKKKNGKTPVELIPDGHYGIVKLFEKAEKNNR